MPNTFANYHKQRAAFKALVSENCSKRILLLKGESGTGKTSLLVACQHEVLGKQTISVQLRGSAVSVTEIFSRSARVIGWERLTQFSLCARKLAAIAPEIRVDGVQQIGETNNLRIALNVQDTSDRERHQTLLTDAWFSDVEALGESLVMVFDTYEEAPTDVKNWLSGPFLSRIADRNAVRVVIAGQCVPDAGIEWNQCHSLYELFGVREASEWLPVVNKLGKKVPLEPAEVWLDAICHALGGRPSEIMKIVKALPDANNSVLKAVAQ